KPRLTTTASFMIDTPLGANTSPYTTLFRSVTDDDGATGTDTCQITVSANTTPVKLTGTVIGTAGSYNNSGNTADKAFDGSLSTFFDAPVANKDNAWVGLDLGTAAVISEIRF